MATRSEQYLMRDGVTRLGAAFFNRVFADLDARLNELEALRVSWEQAVSSLREFGLERIDNALLPVLDEARAAAQEVLDLIQAAGEVVTRGQFEPIAPAVAGEVTLDEQGRVERVTETLDDGVMRVATYNYTDAGALATVTVQIADVTTVTTYHYDAQGALTGWSTT